MTDHGPLDAHFDEDFALEVVHGLRDMTEVMAAVEHARTCPACERKLGVAAGDRERLRARAGEVLGAAAGAPSAVPGRSRRRPGGLVPALAAAALLAIVATAVVLRRPPRTPIAPGLALPAPLEVVHLRTPDEPEDLPRLERAIEAYGRGEWRRTADLLETPFRTPRLDPMRRLYRASALLELGRSAEARELLEPIAHATLPEPYDAWRDWARLRTSATPGDAARADSLVRELAGRPGPLQAGARELLSSSR